MEAQSREEVNRVPEQCNARCQHLVCDRERGHPGAHRGYDWQIDEPLFWNDRTTRTK